MHDCCDLTVLRKAEGLYALLSRRKSAFRLSLRYDKKKRDLSFEDLSNFYDFVESPVQQPVEESRRRLLEAWQRLAAVQKPGAQALADLLILLMETHAVEDLELVIYQRPVMRKELQGVLKSLQNYLPAAQLILTKTSYSTIPPEILRVHNPMHPCLAYYFAEEPAAASIPRELACYLLPLLVGNPGHSPETLRLVYSLDLRNNRSLLATFCRMAQSAGIEKALGWGRILESHLPNRRAALGALFVESGLVNKSTETCALDYFDHLRSIQNKTSYIYRAWFLIQAILKGTPQDYVRLGLSFAGKRLRLPDPPARGKVDASLIRKINQHIRCSENHYRGFVLDLWSACGNVPGMGQVLRTMKNYRDVSADDCLNYLEIFLEFVKGDESISTERSRTMLQLAETVWRDLTTLQPQYREKYLGSIWTMCHSVRRRAASLHLAISSLPLLKRLCCEPLSSKSAPGWLIPKLYSVAGLLHRALLHAPASSWVKFEEAVERTDVYADKGFLALLRVAPALTVKSFQYFPAKLLNTVAALSSLSEGIDRALLMRFRRHPLMQQHFRRKPLQWILEFLRPYSRYSNPVPKRLQQFGLVPGALSRKRLRRYRKELYRNLNLTRLELLQDIIDEAVRIQPPVAFQAHDSLNLYRLYAGSECNKRAMRRFLKAHEQGDQHYVLRHTLTRSWLKKHPDLNLDLWLKGIEFSASIDSFGQVRIAVEQDPMEAWKLGTYVQSCLAAGGCYQQYAAAVVLDINKRVVYVRDSQQRVLARRLLALSEEGRLVCFSVYPAKAAPELKALLRKYCLRFARALRLPIHGQSIDYTIATILSRDWYDDGADTKGFAHESYNRGVTLRKRNKDRSRYESIPPSE